MDYADALFTLSYASFALMLAVVLYRLRGEPLYDPRVLFALASSMWLFIIHGHLTDFDGYLAAKPGLYATDIRLLSAFAISLMVIGFAMFVAGATVGIRLRIAPPTTVHGTSLPVIVSYAMIAAAVLNFAANVVVVSGGNVFAYMTNFAVRSYEIAEGQGISASGYALGVIGVQVLAYCYAREGVNRRRMTMLLIAIGVMTMVRFSQGRIFQTLVLVGATYVAFSLGKAARRSESIPWGRQIHLLAILGLAGVSIYFMRLASALNYLGINISLDTVRLFGADIMHFALQRGNVPNFPIVFTIMDKMPDDQPFFAGATLFNWLLYFIPRAVLEPDYLISLRIKRLWYTDIEGGGLPPTAIGEWYANFGVAGIVAGMFVVGLILGAIYKRTTVSRSPLLGVLWANLALGFIVIYPKTDLAQIPVFSLAIIGALWFVLLVLRSALRRGTR